MIKINEIAMGVQSYSSAILMNDNECTHFIAMLHGMEFLNLRTLSDNGACNVDK